MNAQVKYHPTVQVEVDSASWQHLPVSEFRTTRYNKRPGQNSHLAGSCRRNRLVASSVARVLAHGSPTSMPDIARYMAHPGDCPSPTDAIHSAARAHRGDRLRRKWTFAIVSNSISQPTTQHWISVALTSIRIACIHGAKLSESGHRDRRRGKFSSNPRHGWKLVGLQN